MIRMCATSAHKSEASMSMKYIRDYYGVPAKRGGIIEYTGGKSPVRGVITGADGAWLRIRLEGENWSRRFNPAWKISYLGDKT